MLTEGGIEGTGCGGGNPGKEVLRKKKCIYIYAYILVYITSIEPEIAGECTVRDERKVCAVLDAECTCWDGCDTERR